jgi:hypothetical protein
MEEYDNKNDFGFQQYRVRTHTAHYSHTILQEMFSGRLIFLWENVTWLFCSPDLSPCNYFLRGYLKSEVFKHQPRTIEQPKDAIRQEIAAILVNLNMGPVKYK